MADYEKLRTGVIPDTTIHIFRNKNDELSATIPYDSTRRPTDELIRNLVQVHGPGEYRVDNSCEKIVPDAISLRSSVSVETPYSSGPGNTMSSIKSMSSVVDNHHKYRASVMYDFNDVKVRYLELDNSKAYLVTYTSVTPSIRGMMSLSVS